MPSASRPWNGGSRRTVINVDVQDRDVFILQYLLGFALKGMVLSDTEKESIKRIQKSVRESNAARGKAQAPRSGS